MQIEYEIKITNINPDEVRKKLFEIGATCTIPLRRMQRYVFAHPDKKNAYIRIRQEGNKITSSYKEHSEHSAIDNVKEIEVEINNAEALRQIYLQCGLKEKAIQETYRETWQDKSIIITIDRRPWLKPFIEIEWPDQASVENYCYRLWFDTNVWIYGTVSDIYNKELGIPHDIINNMPYVTFDSPPQQWKE